MHRPIIGLTCNELDKENLPKQFINEAYINSVIRAGGCPIILPITNDYDTIQAQVNLLDGLIVTGGIDVNPMIYNENPEPLQGNSSLDRDYYEMRVLKYAMARVSSRERIFMSGTPLTVPFSNRCCKWGSSFSSSASTREPHCL